MPNRSKHFFKKALSLITALSCLFSVLVFSACSFSEKPNAVTVDGVKISDDVFTYYLDCASVELGVNANYEELKTRAEQLTGTYFKTNSLAHAYGLSLTTAQKASVSEKVNAYWGIYGNYYKNIGITKQTLTKVFTADAYRDALLLYYYGDGGIEEIPVSRLFANFRTNYIVFQAITGYFSETDNSGNTVRLSETDIETLVLKFQNMSSMVNAGEQTMEQAAEYLSETGYKSSVQTVVLHKDDPSYPAGFFDKVHELESRYAAVIGSNDYIFLVLRGDADANSSYFLDKKTDIIKSIVGSDIDTTIEAAYTLDISVSDAVAKGYLSLIKQQKGA